MEIFSFVLFIKNQCKKWWHMPICPTTQEVEIGDLLFNASLGKFRVIPYLKNKLKRMKGLGMCRSSARMLT
jgi:hypothetical protein